MRRCPVSRRRMRKSKRTISDKKAERIFRKRAEKLQSECGWCGKAIGDEEEVFGVSGKALPGIDLSLVQGKVIEITLTTGRHLLAGVAAFDSDAKRAGTDLMFMVCSESCGQQLKAAISAELAARGG